MNGSENTPTRELLDNELLSLYETKEGRTKLKAMLLTQDQLRILQVACRADGRCGSLQTFDGLPCRRFPKPGFTVCLRHGERAPQTINKANRALAAARMPAIEWVMDAMDQANAETCDGCGFPHHSLKERRRLDMLARMIFDRTGLGPHSKVSVLDERDTDSDLQLDSLDEDERIELSGLIIKVKNLKERVRARLEREASGLAPAQKYLE
jgi:hypothetical protein